VSRSGRRVDLPGTPCAYNAAFDMRPFTDAQRTEILRQERIVLDWRALRGRTPARQVNVATDAYLDELLTRDAKAPSRATLFRWLDKYETHGRAGLVDPRWAKPADGAGGMDASPFSPFYAELKTFYLDGNQPKPMTAYRCARAVARRNGWAIPGDRAARRFLSRLPHARSFTPAWARRHSMRARRPTSRGISRGSWRLMPAAARRARHAAATTSGARIITSATRSSSTARAI